MRRSILIFSFRCDGMDSVSKGTDQSWIDGLEWKKASEISRKPVRFATRSDVVKLTMESERRRFQFPTQSIAGILEPQDMRSFTQLLAG